MVVTSAQGGPPQYAAFALVSLHPYVEEQEKRTDGEGDERASLMKIYKNPFTNTKTAAAVSL